MGCWNSESLQEVGRLLDLTFLHLLGYIYQMRDHHSQKETQRGYEKGELNSYYVPKQQTFLLREKYEILVSPYWARELPAGWRDIDHGLTQDYIVEYTSLFRNRSGGLADVARARQLGRAFEQILPSRMWRVCKIGSWFGHRRNEEGPCVWLAEVCHNLLELHAI
jgi:hypothetical protein